MSTPSRRPGRFVPGLDWLEGRGLLNASGIPAMAQWPSPGDHAHMAYLSPSPSPAFAWGAMAHGENAGDRGGYAGVTDSPHFGMPARFSENRPVMIVFLGTARALDQASSADPGTPSLDQEATQAPPSPEPMAGHFEALVMAARAGMGPHAWPSGDGMTPEGSGPSQAPSSPAPSAPAPAPVPGAIVAIPTAATSAESTIPAPADHAQAASPALSTGRVNVGGAGAIAPSPSPALSVPGRSPEAPEAPDAKGFKAGAIPPGPRRDEAAPPAEAAVTEVSLTVPAPIRSDLISEVRPFDGEGLGRVLDALLSRADGLGHPAAGPFDDLSQVVTVVAGALAMEAARRWRNRGPEAPTIRGWSARSSSLRGFF